jgi:hypothetical protein
MPTDAVFARSIDALQDYQKGMLAIGIELPLQLGHESQIV